jgi:hypothetical protein
MKDWPTVQADRRCAHLCAGMCARKVLADLNTAGAGAEFHSGPAASYFSLQLARGKLALHRDLAATINAAGTGARYQIERGLLW